MTTVYGTSLPPGLVASTRGDLRIRIDRLHLHQEMLVEVPVLMPFLKSRKVVSSATDGDVMNDTAASSSANDPSSSSTSNAAVTTDPIELKVLLDQLEDSFAITPLFWGEERPLNEIKEPLTDRTLAMGTRTNATTLVCPVKTLQPQFAAYLQHTAMSPLKGVPLQLIIPASKTGKRHNIVVGAATVGITAVTPAVPISGWFTIVASNAMGEPIPIGRIKAHIAVNFFASSSTAAGDANSAEQADKKGSSSSKAGGSSSSKTGGGRSGGPGAKGAGTPSNGSSSKDGAAAAGRPPLHSHTPPPLPTAAPPHRSSSSSGGGRQHSQQQQQQLFEHQQRMQQQAALLEGKSLLDPSPSAPPPSSSSSLLSQQIAAQQQHLSAILLRGRQMRDELTLASGRVDGPSAHSTIGAGDDAADAVASSDAFTAALHDAYRRHAPSLLANGSHHTTATNSSSAVASSGASLTGSIVEGSGVPMGATKGFSSVGGAVVGQPMGIEHRLVGGIGSAATTTNTMGGGGVSSSGGGATTSSSAAGATTMPVVGADGNAFLMPQASQFEDDDDDEYFNNNDSLSSGDSIYAPSRQHNHHQHMTRHHSSNHHDPLAGVPSSSSLSHLGPHPPNNNRRQYNRHYSEVHVALSEFSFTDVVDEIRIQLRLSKDVSCPTPFEALSSFVYYLPPPTAANVQQRPHNTGVRSISIPLHFTVSSFTSESKLVIECYSVQSREAAPQRGAASHRHHSDSAALLGSPPPPRIIESEALIGVMFLGLYTTAPRLVQFHDPLTGRNPVDAMAEVRVVRGEEVAGPQHHYGEGEEEEGSVNRRRVVESVYADEARAASRVEAKQSVVPKKDSQNGVGQQQALQFASQSYEDAPNAINNTQQREKKRSNRRNHRRRSSSSSSSLSATSEDSSSDDYSSDHSDSDSDGRRRRSRIKRRGASGRRVTVQTSGAVGSTTVTINNDTTDADSKKKMKKDLILGANGVKLVRDVECPLHGDEARRQEAEAIKAAEMARKKAEAEALARAYNVTRLHVSLKQAKELPNVQLRKCAADDGEGGEDNGGVKVFGAMAAPTSSNLNAGGGSSSTTTATTSDGTIVTAPHAFLVIEEFLYYDAPMQHSSSTGGSGGGAADASFGSSSSSGSSATPQRNGGAPTTTPPAASTVFKEFMGRLEEKLQRAETMQQQQGEGGGSGDGAHHHSTAALSIGAPLAPAAQWTVDGVLRGHYDRTLVAEGSNKPQFNYEASVAVQHPPTAVCGALADNSSGSGGGSPVKSALPLSGMLVSLWHSQPSAEEAAPSADEDTKKKRQQQSGGEGAEREEEMRFWSRASRIGTAFVDLKALKYLNTVEGWFRCYSDHHCIDTTVGYLQLAVRKV